MRGQLWGPLAPHLLLWSCVSFLTLYDVCTFPHRSAQPLKLSLCSLFTALKTNRLAFNKHNRLVCVCVLIAQAGEGAGNFMFVAAEGNASNMLWLRVNNRLWRLGRCFLCEMQWSLSPWQQDEAPASNRFTRVAAHVLATLARSKEGITTRVHFPQHHVQQSVASLVKVKCLHGNEEGGNEEGGNEEGAGHNSSQVSDWGHRG